MTSVTTTATMELIPGASAAHRHRYEIDRDAFLAAADMGLGLSALACQAWLDGGATDTGSFRGECLAVLDGENRWRPADGGEPGRSIFTLPALIRYNGDEGPLLEAIDLV